MITTNLVLIEGGGSTTFERAAGRLMNKLMARKDWKVLVRNPWPGLMGKPSGALEGQPDGPRGQGQPRL